MRIARCTGAGPTGPCQVLATCGRAALPADGRPVMAARPAGSYGCWYYEPADSPRLQGQPRASATVHAP